MSYLENKSDKSFILNPQRPVFCIPFIQLFLSIIEEDSKS